MAEHGVGVLHYDRHSTFLEKRWERVWVADPGQLD